MKKRPAKKPAIVSPKKWLTARLALLRREKAFDRARDQLSARRRQLPWVRVDQEYVFTTPTGKKSLAELFDGRSQLIVYHFMLGPDWEEGCRGCSYVSDHFDGALAHLGARDVTLTAVSSAPLKKLQTFKKRMGWKFPWVSSHGSTFNHDYHVTFTPEQLASGKVYYNYATREAHLDELPGLSVFARDKAGNVYHTYSTYSRGLDLLIGTYNLLDLVPKGRDEEKLERSMQWVRHHDRYESAAAR
jgi:predicted dithiol-disulfide oxidoreductase (DUF899 family)